MNKFLAIVVLLLISGKALAHSHPSVDSLTHSLEHLLLGYPMWMPYLLGLAMLSTVVAVLRMTRNRRMPAGRRRSI